MRNSIPKNKTKSYKGRDNKRQRLSPSTSHESVVNPPRQTLREPFEPESNRFILGSRKRKINQADSELDNGSYIRYPDGLRQATDEPSSAACPSDVPSNTDSPPRSIDVLSVSGASQGHQDISSISRNGSSCTLPPCVSSHSKDTRVIPSSGSQGASMTGVSESSAERSVANGTLIIDAIKIIAAAYSKNAALLRGDSRTISLAEINGAASKNVSLLIGQQLPPCYNCVTKQSINSIDEDHGFNSRNNARGRSSAVIQEQPSSAISDENSPLPSPALTPRDRNFSPGPVIRFTEEGATIQELKQRAMVLEEPSSPSDSFTPESFHASASGNREPSPAPIPRVILKSVSVRELNMRANPSQRFMSAQRGSNISEQSSAAMTDALDPPHTTTTRNAPSLAGSTCTVTLEDTQPGYHRGTSDSGHRSWVLIPSATTASSSFEPSTSGIRSLNIIYSRSSPNSRLPANDQGPTSAATSIPVSRTSGMESALPTRSPRSPIPSSISASTRNKRSADKADLENTSQRRNRRR
ncbi:hypothetical protein BDB01DRAFT_838155 [Pilobolus umbonatus]|nr:hypothetical protein BDB01DRAFT_838155 [Pilobolus umbonatus]